MDSSSSVPTGDVPVAQSLLPKRKRGRPKKMPNVAMDMVVQSTLNDIRGTFGMEQSSDPPVDPVAPIVEEQQSSNTVKRGPGRPRKHPLQTDPTDNNTPPVKRGRGRPKKIPTISAEVAVEPVADVSDVSENIDSVSALIVAPPEVMPESTSGQVSITHVPTAPTTSHAPIPLVAISIDQPEPDVLQPSVSGTEMPSSNVPAKRKRGRPRKNPLLTDPVQKKEPEVKIQSNNHISEKLGDDTPLPAAPIVKRGPGRPKKTSLPVAVALVPAVEEAEEPVKKKRGRPRKHPLPTSPIEKRPRGRPRKHPKPDETAEPVVKRKPGRPKKNPVSNDSSAAPPLPPPSTALPDAAGKRKRGRPKKNTTVTVSAAGIPAQSSEPINPSFPTVALVGPNNVEQAPLLNISSDASRSGTEVFQLVLSSSDSEPAESDDVANAIAMLEDKPRKASPLLDERFVESSDEDD